MDMRQGSTWVDHANASICLGMAVNLQHMLVRAVMRPLHIRHHTLSSSASSRPDRYCIGNAGMYT